MIVNTKIIKDRIIIMITNLKQSQDDVNSSFY